MEDQIKLNKKTETVLQQLQEKAKEWESRLSVIQEIATKAFKNKEDAKATLKENRNHFGEITGILVDEDHFFKRWFWKKYGVLSIREFSQIEPQGFIQDIAEYIEFRRRENFNLIKSVKDKKKEEPQALENIFINRNAYKNAIEALQGVNTPVIDRNMNYLLGPREKSAFTAWFDVLKFRGKLLKTDASTMAKLLNQTIKGLNISTDGKTLRTPKNTVHKKTAYRKYYPALLKKIPS